MSYKSQSHKILVVDDDKTTLDLIKEFLSLYYQVETVTRAKEALKKLQKKEYHMVVTDLIMPQMGGLELIEEIKKLYNGLPVIVVSGSATVMTAVQAMKAGAEEIILKPITDLNLMKRLIDRCLRQKWLENENKRLNELLKIEEYSNILTSRSSKMQKTINLVERAAPLETSILLTGETGTGKSLLAKVIHERSRRKNKKFVSVNCGAIADSLLESTLFGHSKGAFTGAVNEKQGLFVEADGGTLFLDEISETSIAFQVKLLNVLESGKIRKVGADSEINIDVRLIFATNRSLREEVEIGNFRRDLFFRINVLNIQIPALRERKEDIIFIANSFLEEFCLKNSFEPKRFAPEVVKVMNNYFWEGNIRELRNCVEYSVIMAPGEVINIDDLPENISGIDIASHKGSANICGLSYQDAKLWFDKRYFDEILNINMGNISKTAIHAGLARQFVYRKLEKLGIDLKNYRKRER